MPVKSLLRSVARRGSSLANQTLSTVATTTAGRRVLERLAEKLDSALAPPPGDADTAEFYGRRYFGGHFGDLPHKPSGYASYTRRGSHADLLADLVCQLTTPQSVLDVGCGRGFLVEALLERGKHAHGCDGSVYAVNTAARGARGHLSRADLRAPLPYEMGSFDVVTAFETLEHLLPETIPAALAELARISRRWVVVTIPSFGPRPPLPSGWFAGKVRSERLAHYESLGPEFEGPVPAEDLAVDANGLPLEGHVCIASFQWWRRQFERVGLTAALETDAAAYGLLERAGVGGFFDWMSFRHHGSIPSH